MSTPAKPSSPVIVAVIDTGVDLSHPDLLGHLWVNPGEIAGNGVDDDHNGIVDDVHGADFVHHTGDPRDDVGHGTHVAGIIAASPNATSGSGGIDQQAKIMALKVSDGSWMNLDAAVEAIYYAVAHGARVINLSWGTSVRSDALEQAIRYAGAHAVLVVAAAGNTEGDNDLLGTYPASYAFDGLVSVAATCDGVSLAPFSNFGKLSVDLAAPGCNVASTAPGGYKTLSGTSESAPLVSGAAALLVARSPAASAADLKRALLGGSRAASSFDGSLVSGGVLDVGGALAALQAPDTTAPAPFTELAPQAGFTVDPSPAYYQSVSFSWTPSRDDHLAGYKLLVDGVPVKGVGSSATGTTVRVGPGEHRWSVVATDRSGNETSG